jgi:hypothetical protein
VWASIGEEEYERQFLFLTKTKKAMAAGPLPSPALKGQLMAAFRAQHAKAAARPTLVVRLLQYRIPAWQAAAAVAALVSFFFLFKQQGFPGMKTEKVYVYLTDTVYKEVSLPAMDSALNAPLGRVNVKPGATNSAAIEYMDTLAAVDSANRNTRNNLAPDSLGDGQHPAGPPKKTGKRWRDLWPVLGDGR